MEKQTLFISYCWDDGNIYADELENQLKDVFEIRRDKTKLIVNDDLYDFMAEIANSDNVILVITSGYVKSLNCMLEMAFLMEQQEWSKKATVLVIDESIYNIETKLEVINYWLLRQKKNSEMLNADEVGKTIIMEQEEYINRICENVEDFLKGISRRKNPTQIAVVSEVIKNSQRDIEQEKDVITLGEKKVSELLKKNGHMTLQELSSTTKQSSMYTRRLVSNLMSKGEVKRVAEGKIVSYTAASTEK